MADINLSSIMGTSVTLTGDVTGTGTGSIATTIGNNTVSLGKLATMATDSFLGRDTAGTGNVEVLSVSTVKTLLNLTGTNSGDQTITLTGNVTGSGTGSFATTIAAGAVTLANMANVATGTVFYRKTASTGVPEVQTLATLKTDLGLTGTNSGDQTITLTGNVTGSGTGSFATTIAANAVTLGNMATMATASFLGRNTASTGNVEVLSVSTVRTMLSISNVENTALSTWAGTANITTVGTIATGTWNATAIAVAKGGTGATATTGTGNNVLSAGPTFTGTIAADIINATGNSTFGAGTGTAVLSVNGASSGTAAGSAVYLKQGGATNIAIGNYSAIIGGAYNGTGLLYSPGGWTVQGATTFANNIAITGSGDPAVPAGYAVTVSGAYGGGVRWVDGSTQVGMWAQNDNSLRIGIGTSSSLTERFIFSNAGDFSAASITATGNISGTWNGNTIPTAKGGTGTTSATGSGSNVLSLNPFFGDSITVDRTVTVGGYGLSPDPARLIIDVGYLYSQDAVMILKNGGTNRWQAGIFGGDAPFEIKSYDVSTGALIGTALSIDNATRVVDVYGLKVGGVDVAVSGTFTPIGLGTTVAGTGTYTAQTGSYIRVGNVVHFTLSVAWSAHTGSGVLRIGGLPFTAATTNPVTIGLFANLTLAANTAIVADILAATNQVRVLAYSTAGGAAIGSAGIAMDTAMSIQVSGTYFI